MQLLLNRSNYDSRQRKQREAKVPLMGALCACCCWHRCHSPAVVVSSCCSLSLTLTLSPSPSVLVSLSPIIPMAYDGCPVSTWHSLRSKQLSPLSLTFVLSAESRRRGCCCCCRCDQCRFSVSFSPSKLGRLVFCWSHSTHALCLVCVHMFSMKTMLTYC